MLTVITNKTGKWDEIVKSFKNYDAYYLSGYTKAFQIHGDGEPMLFYYEDQNMRAMNVVMKRDISKDENFAGSLAEGAYFDLSTPYGYGGFLMEGTITENNIKCLNAEYSTFCMSNNIISEFVRFHPIFENNKELELIYSNSKVGKTISMDLLLVDQIWSNLTSSNRNMIRKAKKNGVKIFWGRDEELFKTFIRLYNTTMDKDNARDYYYFEEEFYTCILNDFKYNSLIFYAEYQGVIIAMSVILFANKNMHYHLSALDRDYQSFAPTNLLLYEAACWGAENGYKTFHLGGGLGAAEDNLYKFKRGFNRNTLHTFVIGKKIFHEELYCKLVAMRKTDIKESTSFFPKYRA